MFACGTGGLVVLHVTHVGCQTDMRNSRTHRQQHVLVCTRFLLQEIDACGRHDGEHPLKQVVTYFGTPERQREARQWLAGFFTANKLSGQLVDLDTEERCVCCIMC